MEGTGYVVNQIGGSGVHAVIYEALKMADRPESIH
jgi:hypothetical protein